MDWVESERRGAQRGIRPVWDQVILTGGTQGLGQVVFPLFLALAVGFGMFPVEHPGVQESVTAGRVVEFPTICRGHSGLAVDY